MQRCVMMSQLWNLVIQKKNSVDIIGLLTSTANINRFLCHHRGSKFSSRIVYFELRWLIHWDNKKWRSRLSRNFGRRHCSGAAALQRRRSSSGGAAAAQHRRRSSGAATAQQRNDTKLYISYYTTHYEELRKVKILLLTLTATDFTERKYCLVVGTS